MPACCRTAAGSFIESKSLPDDLPMMLHTLCIGLGAALMTHSVTVFQQLNSWFAARQATPVPAVPAVQDTELAI